MRGYPQFQAPFKYLRHKKETETKDQKVETYLVCMFSIEFLGRLFRRGLSKPRQGFNKRSKRRCRDLLVKTTATQT